MHLWPPAHLQKDMELLPCPELDASVCSGINHMKHFIKKKVNIRKKSTKSKAYKISHNIIAVLFPAATAH